MHPVFIRVGSLLIPTYGVMAAVGVVAALWTAQFTSNFTLASGSEGKALASRHAWNLGILAVFSALFGSRIVLLIFNFSAFQSHPSWMLAVSMIHHPLLDLAGASAATISILLYSRWQRLRVRLVIDCLAAPVAAGLFFEQVGSLMAGSGFGLETNLPWAVVYSDPFAFKWSGAPLGVSLHPAQVYAAMGYGLVAVVCIAVMRYSTRPGSVCGVCLMGLGLVVAATEIFRDWSGRGILWGGRADIPQLLGLGMVMAGSAFLVDWAPPGRCGVAPTAFITPD